MEPTTPAVSRRGILTAAAAAGSALALAVPTAASASTTAAPAVPLVEHSRIGAVLTRSPSGAEVTLRYAPDFHDRLGDWMRLWWANAPGDWIAPFELTTAGTSNGGHALLLVGISYTRTDRLRAGFDASVRDSRYWATLASLYHHFPRVTAGAGHLEISDGHPGFTGGSDQVSFVRAAIAGVWAGSASATGGWAADANRILRAAGGSGDITSRQGWSAFTEATLRRGLSVHHNR
ncbi:hypothetical protein F4553_001724 [Allocatelliglobosispora scoriae]|uniref:Uncharacterized protein n=1 Tax=Allocatelliglobosispora scoriae TaxID=643052 RepID=A0A841BL34_9ACTN|nr:hypothetical protein [Allocatelliglobosispora scoriae]MBB5868345.1 hypothetical protein [Allocatelliglobosispora scoriae]